MFLNWAAGFGQPIGSAAGGWLFSELEHRSFGWLTLPLVVMLGLVLTRPRLWWVIAVASTTRPRGTPKQSG